MTYFIYFNAVILPWLLVLGLIIYFLITKKKISALRLLGLSFFSAILAWFIASLYKYNFPSPRPFELIAEIQPLFSTARGDAFPSSHATFFGALAESLYLQNKKIGLIFIIGAVIISLARFWAGVHWFNDIAVGLFFGSAVSLIVWSIFYHIYPR